MICEHLLEPVLECAVLMHVSGVLALVSASNSTREAVALWSTLYLVCGRHGRIQLLRCMFCPEQPEPEGPIFALQLQ